jgi:hypothetical protein
MPLSPGYVPLDISQHDFFDSLIHWFILCGIAMRARMFVQRRQGAGVRQSTLSSAALIQERTPRAL